MIDSVTPARRSQIMSRVKSRDTRPEMEVRQLIYSMGYRYRLHSKDLPGKPDLVFRKRKKVIFVHGCFWHRHSGCALARMPKSRTEFWLTKLESNRQRDIRNQADLENAGWKVFTVWECELQNPNMLKVKIKEFLDA